MRSADVIVIGAGVLGMFHAYFAAQKGYKTVLIERNPFPNDASARNFGMIVQSIVEAGGEWAEHACATAEIYQAIQSECDIGVRPTGSLYIASTEVENRVLQEFAQAAGPASTCIYLDADETCYRYRRIQPSYCVGALFFPHDLTIEPRHMLRQLIGHVVQRGLLEYLPATNVIGVASSDRHCTVTDSAGNVLLADRVIVCSGAEYRRLFPALFRISGLTICKLQMMQTVPQPHNTLPHSILSGLSIERYRAFKICPSYSLLQQQAVDEQIRAYGIHLLFKQAADGAVIIGDSHEYSAIEHASALEESTSSAINAAILRYGRQMLDLPDRPYVDQQQLAQGLDRALVYLDHIHAQGYTGIAFDNLAHLVTFERAPIRIYRADSSYLRRAAIYRAAFAQLFERAAQLGAEWYGKIRPVNVTSVMCGIAHDR